MSLGRYIRQMRKAKGWTQEELERRTGISQSHISQYERDDIKMPTPAVLWALADALGVHESELVRAMGYIRPRLEDNPPIPPQLQAIYDDLQKLPPDRRALRLEALSQIAKTLQNIDNPGTNNHSPEAEAQP